MDNVVTKSWVSRRHFSWEFHFEDWLQTRNNPQFLELYCVLF